MSVKEEAERRCEPKIACAARGLLLIILDEERDNSRSKDQGDGPALVAKFINGGHN
jgi:hypothetical protein